MNENQIRQIVKDELSKSQQTGAPFVAPHLHDGVSNLAINQKDVTPNDTFSLSLFVTNPSASSLVERFTISGITAFTQLTLNAFAANNASAPATQRAMVNGIAVFGKGTLATQINPLDGLPVSFSQATNSLFTNETGPAFRVGMSTEYITYVVDGSAAEVAKIQILEYGKGSITFEATLAAGWQVQGAYIIT